MFSPKSQSVRRSENQVIRGYIHKPPSEESTFVAEQGRSETIPQTVRLSSRHSFEGENHFEAFEASGVALSQFDTHTEHIPETMLEMLSCVSEVQPFATWIENTIRNIVQQSLFFRGGCDIVVGSF